MKKCTLKTIIQSFHYIDSAVNPWETFPQNYTFLYCMKNSALWLHIKWESENSSRDKTSYLVPIYLSSKETYGKLHDNSLTTLSCQRITSSSFRWSEYWDHLIFNLKYNPYQTYITRNWNLLKNKENHNFFFFSTVFFTGYLFKV